MNMKRLSCLQRITKIRGVKADCETKEKKLVAVIGGGVAGLVAARHLNDPSCPTSVVLFEQTDQLGGTWVYTERTGLDNFGLPIHSSMYKGLRTNLPKETMMFPDFPHTKQGASYLTAKEVLQYLNDYADNFKIRNCVKFNHHINEIIPFGEQQWKIRGIDLLNEAEKEYIFDAVIVANGHNSKPKYQKIEGIAHFKGQILHSHDFRDSTTFKDKSVLVIGAGPSGLDLTFTISTVTDKIVLSHHTEYAARVGFPTKVVLKPDVNSITKDGRVKFQDGSVLEFDVILFCTGYYYTIPFLNKECGISCRDNYVSPLFKGIINIHHPTMAFLGLLKHTTIFYLCDLQIRFFIQTLLKPSMLPSKNAMLHELTNEENGKIQKGIRTCDFHQLGETNPAYIDDIARLAGVAPIPSIILRIYFDGYEKIFNDFKNFRHNHYRIIDQEHFTVVDLRAIMAEPFERIHEDHPPSRGRNGALVQARKNAF